MNPSLTVYISEPAAPPCTQVLDYLDRRGYEYTTVAVATADDQAEMKQRAGYATCPPVVADAT